MSWNLYSRKNIQKGINNNVEYADENITISWIANLLYYVQSPIFWLLSIPCRIPIIDQLCEFVATNWGRGTIGFILRSVYWKTKLRNIGEDVFIDKGVTFFPNPKNVEIGNNVHIDVNVIVMSGGKLSIGNNVQIASGSLINSSPFINIQDNVTIGANCIIMGGGTRIYHEGKYRPLCSLVKGHVDILRGVTIKKYAAIAPGARVLPTTGHWVPPFDPIYGEVVIGYASVITLDSFVSDSIGDYELWGGCPAKKLFDIKILIDEFSKTNDKVTEYLV